MRDRGRRSETSKRERGTTHSVYNPSEHLRPHCLSLCTTSFPSQLMVSCVWVHVSFSRYVCAGVGLGLAGEEGEAGGRFFGAPFFCASLLIHCLVLALFPLSSHSPPPPPTTTTTTTHPSRPLLRRLLLFDFLCFIRLCPYGGGCGWASPFVAAAAAPSISLAKARPG